MKWRGQAVRSGFIRHLNQPGLTLTSWRLSSRVEYACAPTNGGVEEETLACGTGAVASAIISSRFKGAGDSPIQVEMPGGILIVDFKNRGNSFEDVWLKGKVEFVYEGRM